jgi:hypothetical protein
LERLTRLAAYAAGTRHVQGNRAYKKQPLANLEFVLGHSRLPLHKEIKQCDVLAF